MPEPNPNQQLPPMDMRTKTALMVVLIFALAGTVLGVINLSRARGTSGASKQEAIDSATVLVNTAKARVERAINSTQDALQKELADRLTYNDFFGSEDRPQYISRITFHFKRDSSGIYHLVEDGKVAPDTDYSWVPIYNLIASSGSIPQTMLESMETNYQQDSSWMLIDYYYSLPQPGTQPKSQIAQTTTPYTPTPQVVAAKDTSKTAPRAEVKKRRSRFF